MDSVIQGDPLTVHFLIIGGMFSGALAITPWAAAAAVRQAVE